MSKLVTPQQAKALDNYRNPASETFGDLKNSCIKAGFSVNYADAITGQMPTWLADSYIEDVKTIKTSQNNIKKIVSMNIDFEDMKNIDLTKLQIETSKFVLKSLAKAKWDEDEKQKVPDVQINIVNYGDNKKPDTTEPIDVEVK